MNFSEILNHVSSYVFSIICHQNESVLIEVSEQSIMLCPRCSGLHIGFFFTLLILLQLKTNRIKLTGRFSTGFFITALSFIFLEWVLAQFGTFSSTTVSRYFTGLFAGTAFGMLLLAYRRRVFKSDNYQETSNQLLLIVSLAIVLFSGLLFFQLTNWMAITLTLLLAVVINFFVLVHTLFYRMHLMFFTQKQKSI